MNQPPWHHLAADEALAAQQSGHAGLAAEEAARRLAEHGPNRLTPPKRRSPFMRFLLQFHNVLIYVLLAAAFVTALLAHWVDTAVIVGVVVINAIIGFIQEGKAEQAMDAIRRMLSPEATVLRDGKRHVIPAETLVPGDIVLLASGDKVPADLRLLHTKNLRIEEAALTGESTAVEKTPPPWMRRRCSATAPAWPIPARWWYTGRAAAWWWRPPTPPRSGASARCWKRCRP